MERKTGITQALGDMYGSGFNVVEGIVLSPKPLQIKLVNNEKMVLDSDITTIPRHLTDYKTKITIPLASGAQLVAPTTEENAHSHSCPDGGTSTVGAHKHSLVSLKVVETEAIIHNGLKKDDVVVLLGYNNGKSYYILDRKGQ